MNETPEILAFIALYLLAFALVCLFGWAAHRLIKPRELTDEEAMDEFP